MQVVIIANLKARNMRGVKSHGMLLCASNKEAGQVEPLQPPEDAQARRLAATQSAAWHIAHSLHVSRCPSRTHSSAL